MHVCEQLSPQSHGLGTGRQSVGNQELGESVNSVNAVAKRVQQKHLFDFFGHWHISTVICSFHGTLTLPITLQTVLKFEKV